MVFLFREVRMPTDSAITYDDISLFYKKFVENLQKRIIGLENIIEHIVISILCGNHSLLIGVPGLGKTYLISSLAELLALKFSRIQFTPDLMPSDIIGTEILSSLEENRNFNFLKGPIFANIILADEINRTPPKTQSALLEAMEEHSVSSFGQHFKIELPFFVLATQNPIEQEGTYPLPLSQLDRFMFQLNIDYPSIQVERKIMRQTICNNQHHYSPILTKTTLLHFMDLVRKTKAHNNVIQYAVELCRKTRPQESEAPLFIKENVSWGVGPRATQCLILGAKARALLLGRDTPQISDIQAISHAVLRHRILLSYQAIAEGISVDHVIDKLLKL